MKSFTVNILGTDYKVQFGTPKEDDYLNDCAGYTDKTVKKIVVTEQTPDCEFEDFKSYQRKVLRHELIHAALFESGLHESWTHENGHDETYVDWIATQFPKLIKIFDAAGAL